MPSCYVGSPIVWFGSFMSGALPDISPKRICALPSSFEIFFLLLFLLKKPNKSRDTKLCIFPWIFSFKCQMVRSDVFGGLTWNYVTLSFPGWPWKRQTQKMERDKKKKRTWIVAQVWEHFTRPLVKHCPLVVTVYFTNSSQKNFN